MYGIIKKNKCANNGKNKILQITTGDEILCAEDIRLGWTTTSCSE